MNIEKDKMVKIPEIILKEINQEATNEEKKILQEWLVCDDENKKLYQKLRNKENLVSIINEYDRIDDRLAWGKILERIEHKKKRNSKHLVLRIFKYAALLLIPISFAVYFLFQPDQKVDSGTTFTELEKQISQLQESSLITAKGEIINLKATSKESIVEIDGTQIAKKDSTLLYKGDKKQEPSVIQYNSLVTPRSEVFSVILADGTKVWLNASSAIKYPTRFDSDIRKVFLTGEAYFEVKRDTEKPFIVSTSKMEIEVLGTSFNVMAYPNERVVETTLISGVVNINTSKSSFTLEPGMQARLDKNTEILDQIRINTELITSWRFGKYVFEYENLESVMNKLSRWYNIEISFVDEGKKNIHFSGTLYKYYDINETLHIIELTTNVKFKNSGNIIAVN